MPGGGGVEPPVSGGVWLPGSPEPVSPGNPLGAAGGTGHGGIVAGEVSTQMRSIFAWSNYVV